MEKTIVQSASEAREIAIAAQQKNTLDQVLKRISDIAPNGFTECTTFGLGALSMENVQQLMRLGFSVSSFIHPFEQITLYRIAW